jgi:hypothetical protein
VRSYPSCKLFLAHRICREPQRYLNSVRLFGYQSVPVLQEKKTHRLKSGSFVAIVKRVIANQAKGIGRCKRGEVRVGVVQESIPRSGERGLQQILVANSIKASKLRQ